MNAASWDGLGRLVAANGLPGAILEPPEGPLDHGTWERLVVWSRAERLTGQLAAWAGTHRLPATADQAVAARRAHAQEVARLLPLEQLVVQAAEALESAGVPYRLLDEPAVARLCALDPHLRTFGQIELLVDPRCRQEAVAALAATGLRRHAPRVVWGALAPGRSDVLATAAGAELFIHTRLPGVRRAGSSESVAFRLPASALEVDGRAVPGLPAEAALLHAAWRATVTRTTGSLVRLRDVVELTLSSRVSFRAALQLAARAGAEHVLARGVRQAWDEFRMADVVPLSVWALRRTGPPAVAVL